MRWEFYRYDHRVHGVANSRGFLHYIGLGPVLLVWGFHRGVLGGYGYGRRYNGRPYAWLEFTLYAPGLGVGKSIYPRWRIPRSWL
jgi:hypothetical protein